MSLRAESPATTSSFRFLRRVGFSAEQLRQYLTGRPISTGTRKTRPQSADQPATLSYVDEVARRAGLSSTLQSEN